MVLRYELHTKIHFQLETLSNHESNRTSNRGVIFNYSSGIDIHVYLYSIHCMLLILCVIWWYLKLITINQTDIVSGYTGYSVQFIK